MMAPPTAALLSLATTGTFLLLLLLLQAAPRLVSGACSFPAIFSFGDSLQDTGNFINTYANTTTSKLPWGTTFFHRATGRFSDGRLVLDFIAEHVGLPLVPPYIGGGQNFRQGANFAFAGATAMRPVDVAKLGINTTGWSDHSLFFQIDWFKQLLRSVPSLNDPNFLAKSLFMVGEIGGNEYNSALSQNWRLDAIKSTVAPKVVETIGAGVVALIRLGAKTMVVPGNLPIGCVPAWLDKFHSPRAEDYDENGCLVWLNDFSQFHNDLLGRQLNRIRKAFPDVTIAYADYYGAGLRMFSNQRQFGITVPFKACCGGGGHGCDETGPVCSNPLNHASWEGFHPTQATYSAIADGLINGPFSISFLTCK